MLTASQLIPHSQHALSHSNVPSTICTTIGADWPEFMSLAESERDEITLALEIMREIEAAPTRRRLATMNAIARRLRHQRPDLRGWSASSIRAKHRIWTKGGSRQNGRQHQPYDWRAFIRDYSGKCSDLPPAFLSHLVELYSRTTRENDAWAGCYRRLTRDWLAGEEIPGYGTAPQWYAARGMPMPTHNPLRTQDLPEGWTEGNLWRRVKRLLPRSSTRRAAQGQANRLNTTWAAQLLRDRSNLRPLELWTMDDVRLDLQARMYIDGAWQIVYVEAVMAMDVATGLILDYFIKGSATRSADTETGRAAGSKMSIQSRDIRHLTLSVLTRYGLPVGYKSTLLTEEATAKLNKADERKLLDMLAGRFEIDHTGMGHGCLLESGFREDWGRPGLKGWIESWFRLLHTSLNDLPGTTVRRYDQSRGDLPARLEYTRQLIKRAEKLINGPLTPDHPLNRQLQWPVYTVDEVTTIVGTMIDQLNRRTQHRMQGFERRFEHRDSDRRWLTQSEIDTLAPQQRAGLILKPRMESPAERWQRLCHGLENPLQPLDPRVLYALHAERRPATIRGRRISISLHTHTTDRLTYVATDPSLDLDDYEEKHEAVLAHLPENAAYCVLTDAANGSVIGILHREGRVDITDETALGKAAGRVHREMQAELDTLRTHLAPQQARHRLMRDTNESVLTTPADAIGSAMATAREQSVERSQKQQRYARTDDLDDSLLTPDPIHPSAGTDIRSDDWEDIL